MTRKQKTIAVNDILNTALKEAANTHYCLNCKFSYLTKETGYGYCKFHTETKNSTLYLKPIEEYDTCDHWERKK